MIAKQSVFLNLERDKAFEEGHGEARFLLVRAGQEIADTELEKYDGAEDIANSAAPEVEVIPIPPPTLKKHGQSEGENSQVIPDPKIKSSDGEKRSKASSSAAPKIDLPKTRGKKPKK